MNASIPNYPGLENTPKEPLPLTAGHALLKASFMAGIAFALQTGCTLVGILLWSAGAPIGAAWGGCVVYVFFAGLLPLFVTYRDFDSVPRDLCIKRPFTIFLFGWGLTWACALIIPLVLLFSVLSARKKKESTRQGLKWFVESASRLVHS